MEFLEGAPSSISLVTGPKRVVRVADILQAPRHAGVRYGYGSPDRGSSRKSPLRA